MTADVTGTITETINGQAYELRLTMAGLAKLQAKHGKTIGGLLDGTAGNVPDFGPMLDMVSVALQKASGLGAVEADGLADDLLTADLTVIERLITAAFPNAQVSIEGPQSGNARKPKQAA